MSFACRLKCYISSFLVIYALYLVTYKCNKLDESPLEHGIESVFHPLSHHHNALCDGLNKGIHFVNPYFETAGKYFDQHVRSHDLFKQYSVDGKLEAAKASYYQHVYPLVIKFFEFFEVVEYHVIQHLIQQWARVQAFYAGQIAPKLA